jgi:hypothetical protein
VNQNGLVSSSSFAPLEMLTSSDYSDFGLADSESKTDDDREERSSPQNPRGMSNGRTVADEKSPSRQELDVLPSRREERDESSSQAQASLENCAAKKKSGRKRNKRNVAKSGDKDSKGKELVLAQKHVIKCGKLFSCAEKLSVSLFHN